MIATSHLTQLATDGFAVLRGLERDATSLDIAGRLGIVDRVEGLAAVQTLIPRRIYDSPPNTYSGNFGRAEFPLHTDLAHWARPPRYIVLRCIQGAQDISTRLLDGRRTLIDTFGLDKLCATLVQPRRQCAMANSFFGSLAGQTNFRVISYGGIAFIFIRPLVRPRMFSARYWNF
jgi:hypothetical protein